VSERGSTPDDELIAAYVDGVAELSPAERRRVEHALEAPQARADADAARALIGELRALPPEGREPDWAALEAAIRGALPAHAPRAWWKTWRLAMPIGALAACGAALALWLAGAPAPSAPQVATTHGQPPAAEAPRAEPAPANAVLFLDGQPVDVDAAAADDQLGDLDREARDAFATEDDAPAGGVLPLGDLRWIDGLDDHQIDRAEAWLEAMEREGKHG
jgi:hypothetical protein